MRRLLGVTVVALLLVSCSRTDGQFRDADEWLKAGEYGQAASVLGQITPSSADHQYRLHTTLAIAHAGLGELAESIRHTRAALELDRRSASLEMIEIAAHYFNRGRVGDAQDYYEPLQPLLFYTAGKPDLDTWRVPRNLAALARRLNENELADRALAQAETLRQHPVIVVVIYTLRADHLGTYGYARATSPNLDRWAREGRVFERAYSTSSWTLPSFGTLFTGYLPTRHRAGAEANFERGKLVRGGTQLSPSVQTVAEMFSAQGFKTGAVANNPFLGPPFGVDRGFEVYDHVPGDNHDIRRADVMVDRSLALIDQWGGEPFFLVVHLFDPHMDYDPPPEFRGKFSGALNSRFSLPFHDIALRRGVTGVTDEDWEFIRAAYDEEIAFVDQQLGRLRQGLIDRNLLNRTLVLLTADHGEELFDHGGFEHGHAMWEEVLRIPLVFWGPGISPGRESMPVSLTDVAPTLLDWIDVPIPEDFDGQSLWPTLSTGVGIPDRTLVAEGRLYGPNRRALIRWPLKLILDENNRPLRVADLATDPGEHQNMLQSDPDRVDEFVRNLVRELRDDLALAEGAPIQPQDEPVELDEDTLERLRSLGYLR